jgi:hypothetical protein
MTDLDITTFNAPNGYVTTDFDAVPTINSLSNIYPTHKSFIYNYK